MMMLMMWFKTMTIIMTLYILNYKKEIKNNNNNRVNKNNNK